MSRLLDDDQELETEQRELTLNTGAILAIFLGLVLLCAVFFGFGYNLGRKSTTGATVPPVPAANADQPATANNSTFDNFKPSPSSPSNPAPAPVAISAAPAAASAAPSNTVTVGTQPPPPTTHTTPAPPRPAPPAAVPTASAPTPHTTPAAPQTAPGGSFVVQIAAISSTHKDDADLLVNALHNKGYDVAERTEQDKLIHIQVGPFATKADAEAMRERLIIDGYNAIVK